MTYHVFDMSKIYRMSTWSDKGAADRQSRRMKVFLGIPIFCIGVVVELIYATAARLKTPYNVISLIIQQNSIRYRGCNFNATGT